MSQAKKSLSYLMFFLAATLIATVTCNPVAWLGKSYTTSGDFVEVIDGVEYINAEERNATLLAIFG